MATPTARYEADGAFYLDHPFEPPQPLTDAFLAVLARNLPTGAIDTEADNAVPMTTWVDWRYAGRAEAIAKLFWPALDVTAAANPGYRGCNQWVEVARALSEARQAVTTAEALVRRHTNPMPSFGRRTVETAGRR
jgi:hypothetical protein